MLIKKLLPPEPSLEHLKKQAKHLFQDYEAGKSEAISRFIEYLPRLSRVTEEEARGVHCTLQDAQLVVAREYGFASWPKLVAAVEHNIFPESYNHQAPEMIERRRALERSHEVPFARRLGDTYAAVLGQKVDVEMAFTDETTHGEVVMSLSDPTCACTFNMEGLNTRAGLNIAMPVAFALLDKDKNDEFRLSQTELEQMRPVFQQLVDGLERIWRQFVDTQLTNIELVTDPNTLDFLVPKQIVGLMAWLPLTEGPDQVYNWDKDFTCVWYPDFVYEPLLTKMAAHLA